MTSKEALETIRSVDGSISVEQTINECCDIIKKDLEILDILKPYLKEVIKINKNKGYLSIRFKPIEYGTLEVDGIKNEVADRINIIKRWLDNGL